MFTKICPYCQAKSYSASTFGKWVCPTCQADISRIDAYSGIINDGDDPRQFKIYPSQYEDEEDQTKDN